MFTVAETESFAKQSKRYWDKEARDAFITFIANHPDAGDVVPGSGGVRKGSMARQKQGEKRWCASNLLQHAGSGDDLVIADLWQERQREHSRKYATASKGDG